MTLNSLMECKYLGVGFPGVLCRMQTKGLRTGGSFSIFGYTPCWSFVSGRWADGVIFLEPTSGLF